MTKRVPITRTQRWRILERDNFTCRYCGLRAPDIELQIDHVIPASKGGSSQDSNLVAACVECNAGKRADLLSVDYVNSANASINRGFHDAANCLSDPFELTFENVVIAAIAEVMRRRDPATREVLRDLYDWRAFFAILEQVANERRKQEERELAEISENEGA